MLRYTEVLAYVGLTVHCQVCWSTISSCREPLLAGRGQPAEQQLHVARALAEGFQHIQQPRQCHWYTAGDWKMRELALTRIELLDRGSLGVVNLRSGMRHVYYQI